MYGLTPILENALASFDSIRAETWEAKPNPEKWSKKEVLGHLIDSALNNLQRFTEIQTSTKPYLMRGYAQDDLVNANKYQARDHQMIIQLWIVLNEQIAYVMKQQTTETQNYQVQMPNGEKKTLAWLMEDYVVHLQHHLQQILKS